MEVKSRDRHTGFVFTAWTRDRPNFAHDFILYSQSIGEIAPDPAEGHDGFHWQCYIYTKQISRSAAFKFFPGVAWDAFLPQRGNFDQARDYCTLGKGRSPPDTTGVPGTEQETGVRPRPGQRNDYHDAADAIVTGGWAAVPNHMIMKFHRGLTFVRAQRGQQERIQKELHWFYGEDEERVLDEVYREAGQDFYFTNSLKWLTHYDGQPCLIVRYNYEEMGPAQVAPLISSAPYLADSKNGHVPITASKIIFFSDCSITYLGDKLSKRFKSHLVGGPLLPPDLVGK